MKYSIRVTVFLFFILNYPSMAQINLVPNPSFEDTIHCPFMPSQINFANHWYKPTGGTSDYFNNCSVGQVGVPSNVQGTQLARTGNGYAGFITYYAGVNQREYIQTQLDSILKPNHNYCVNFYVNLADSQDVACNNFGMYFSDTAISSTSWAPLYVLPQINNNILTNHLTNQVGWTLISGNFIAIGGEAYITLGNFLSDANSDTTRIHFGSNIGSYYYIDDISVIDCTDVGIREESGRRNDFKLYPNPNNGNMQIESYVPENTDFTLTIYDVAGRIVNQQNLNSRDKIITLNKEDLNAGVYYYDIKSDNGTVKSEKLVIVK